MSEQFGVVGCRECGYHWVTADLETHTTSQCRRCGTEFSTDTLRVRETFGHWERACEYRARLLADRAGQLQPYEHNVADFGTLEAEIQDRLGTIHEANAATFEAQVEYPGADLDEHVDDKPFYADTLADEADAYLDSLLTPAQSVTVDPDDRPECAVDGGGSLIPSQQDRTAAASVTLDDPVTEVSAALLGQPALKQALVKGLCDLGHEHDASDLDRLFERAGVDGLRQQSVGASRTALVADYARRTAQGDAAATYTLLQVLQQLGKHTTLGVQSARRDVFVSYTRLFAALEWTPTITVRVDADFFELRSDHRRWLCEWLAELGRGCEVYVVGTGLTLRKLGREYREQLPSTFSERCSERRTHDTPIDEQVQAARNALDPDGTAVEILRNLATQADETRSYKSLAADFDLTKGRISQLLSTLEDHALAQRFGPRNAIDVELLPAGSALLDRLDGDVGRQKELDDAFSDARQRCDRPCNHARGRGGPDGTSSPYHTQYLPRHRHAAIFAATSSGGVTTSRTVPPAYGTHTEDLDRIRWVSFDDQQDEAVVAVRATTSLQYISSVATALASRPFLEEALPSERIETIDLSPYDLRGARCIGALSEDAVDNPDVFREALLEWGNSIAKLTTKLKHDDTENRERLCSTIVRSSQGLAGTIVHLLDVAGIDVARELYIPEQVSHSRLADLAKTLTLSIRIQGRYDQHTIQRALFEHRDAKLKQMRQLEIDAADPLGDYIGGLSLRGEPAHDLGRHLEQQLQTLSARADAPEVAVDLDVAAVGRPEFVAVCNRILTSKRIATTPEAVTLCRSLTNSLESTAQALHALSPEDGRDIRLNEIRVALATLNHEQLLPDHKPTVGKAISALLRTDRPVSETQLAALADISARSVSRHREVLEALDLVRGSEDGLRLALPFHSGDERGTAIVPEPVADAVAAVQDYLFDIALQVVNDPSRMVDLDDPLGASLTWPLDKRQLCTECPALEPWVSLARRLTDAPALDPPTVRFGRSLRQASLQETDADGSAVGD